MTIPLETIRRAPKVLLHDHLDGGLRPGTIVELAAATGYDGLPTTDADELAAWIRRGADRKSLELYLETFAHTVGVHADARGDRPGRRGVRRGPRGPTASSTPRSAMRRSCRPSRGLTARHGGRRRPRGLPDRLGPVGHQLGRSIIVRQLVTAMRQADRALEVAELAIRHRDDGVVGFDIAGPEAGYPPGRFAEAFHRLTHASFHLTLHAGEGYGLPSIREAIDLGAERLGPRRPDRRRHRGRAAAVTPDSGAWPPMSAIGGSRSSCARRRTSTPGWPPRSPSTRSTCSGGFGSGSPSTPTTG